MVDGAGEGDSWGTGDVSCANNKQRFPVVCAQTQFWPQAIISGQSYGIDCKARLRSEAGLLILPVRGNIKLLKPEVKYGILGK